MTAPGAFFQTSLAASSAPEPTEPARAPAWRWIADNFLVKDSETGKPVPFVVFPWHARLLLDVLPDAGHLPYNLVVVSQPKKSGKTTVDAAIGANLMFNRAPGGSEFYNFGNSKEQATGRVFQAIRYAVKRNPRLMAQCSQVLLTLIRLHNDTLLQSMAAKDANIAGASPYYSGWTELWGFEFEDDIRAWEEMVPPPTIRDSIRVVDTYAGYEGESGLLNGIEDLAKASTRLYGRGFELPAEYRSYALDVSARSRRLRPFLLPPDDPGHGPVRFGYGLPVYVNKAARLYCFWDDGIDAHRMPWQVGPEGDAYYEAEELTLTPTQYARLHLNKRAKRGGQYVAQAAWDGLPEVEPWKPGDRDAVYLSVDAATRDDHLALVGVRLRDGRPEECLVQEWEPTPSDLDDRDVIDPRWALDAILDLRRQGMAIRLLSYDPYQFHSLALELASKGVEIFEVTQGQPRLEADTFLRTLIRDGKLAHTHDARLRDAVGNANAMEEKGKTGDERKVRIIKGSGKVDPLVALSMAVWGALREPPAPPGASSTPPKQRPQETITGRRTLGVQHADRGPRNRGNRRR